MDPWIDNLVHDISRDRTPVMLVPVVESGVDVTQMEPLLSDEERTRSRRFHHQRDFQTFVTGRWIVRRFLSSLLGDVEVEVRVDAKGKPSCPHPDAPWFNLSHAGGWVALVLDRKGPVGIDIEDTQRRLAMDAVTRRYFSAAEQEVVRVEGADGFFRMWTRKEARLKASGTGLSVKVSHVDTMDEENRGEWQFYEFPKIGSLRGTVSCNGPRRDVELYQWFPGDERLQSVAFPVKG
jgi:phosphopantetheinyl transferase